MPTSTRLPLPLGGRSTPVARQHLLEASTSPCPYKPLYAPDIYYFSFSFFPHVVISTRVCPYSEHQAGLARNIRNHNISLFVQTLRLVNWNSRYLCV